jgi:diphosphomevalonate decarboxylase
MTNTYTGRARANANIALIKYWGKRATALNLPAVGSISITLDSLNTETQVDFDDAAEIDQFLLNGEPREAMVPRVIQQLDLLRQLAGMNLRARVVSHNNFPTGAGLASSASGFAALTAAAAQALELNLTPRVLSQLARQGSASAARSIFGGFVELHRGMSDDGEDCYAEPVLAADAWPLEVVVAVTDAAEKTVGSREGMLASVGSPYFPPWVATNDADLQRGRRAILSRDFGSLATVAEESCLKMHGLMLATVPGLLYWRGATLECLHRIRALRAAGTGVFFTVDAGPQVKAVCEPGAAESVRQMLADVAGVTKTWVSALGGGVQYP